MHSFTRMNCLSVLTVIFLCLAFAANAEQSCPQGQIPCRDPYNGKRRRLPSDYLLYPPCGDNASQTCKDCPAGTFAIFNGTGDQSCRLCPPGTFGQVAGSWSQELACPSRCATGSVVKFQTAQERSSEFGEYSWEVPANYEAMMAMTTELPTSAANAGCKSTCTDAVEDARLDSHRCGNLQMCSDKIFEIQIARLEENGKRCFICDVGYFNTNVNETAPTVAAVSFSSKTCQKNRVCNAGFRIETKGTPVSDQTCIPCPPGTFTGSLNSESCMPWKVCSSTERSILNGTDTSDTICIPHPAIGPKGDPGARGFNGSAGVCPSNCRSLKRHDYDLTPSGVEGDGSSKSSLADVEPWMLAFFASCGVMLVSTGLMCKYVSDLKITVRKLQNQIEGKAGMTQAANRNSWDMRKILSNVEHNVEMRPINSLSESAVGLSIGRELPKPVL